MRRRPLILVSADVAERGQEFGDFSMSLSQSYNEALLETGAIPVALPATVKREILADAVARSEGVLLTGGEDVDPRLYTEQLPAMIERTVTVTPDGGGRDLRELLLIDEVFRQQKPLLAICRGHQVLNVALGGTLVADIEREIPHPLQHRRNDKRHEVVHEVRLTAGSLLAKIADTQTLGVNSTHHQAVGQVAAPLQVTAQSTDGVIEGLELKRGGIYRLPFLLSVQFHPERLAGKHREHRNIFRWFTRACSRSGNKNYEGQSPDC
jgi:putative glutamine amidotransferase